MLDRRALLSTAAAAAAASALPAAAQTRNSASADAQLNAVLDRLVEQELEQRPQSATTFGLDVGPQAGLRARLNDRTQAGEDRETAGAAKALAELKALNRGALSPSARIGLDAVSFQLDQLRAINRFAYGAQYSAYALTQRYGAYSTVPDFLDKQHPVANAADADAYLSRLEGYATALDQDTERFSAEVAAGAVPPDFILDTALGQLRRQRAQPASEATVVASLVRRSAERGLPASYGQRAAALYTSKVVPALDRQMTAVERVRRTANPLAGVWKNPEGEAYYAAKLKWFTTTDMTAEEVHRLGLEQVAEITGRLDALFKSQGLTQGTVLQRLQALNADPVQLFPNDDAGRAKLLGFLNERMADLDRRLPSAFDRLPKAKVRVMRVPPEIQDGAANGYYQSPSIDGARPGAFYINLKDTTEWPRWSLPSLVYHEANPGHHLQIALALEDPSLPLYRRGFLSFSAYTEGWGLYAEQVADELGVYANDPLGRVGLLQSYLFRAARLAVDTGIHHKRWTREQANQWMVQATGDPPGQVAREVDRYATNPGQACSYKVGQTVILRLREDTRRRLGDRFDIKAFHAAVLSTGEVPLTVLERAVAEQLA
jgi:uncharacterized protein (DUF885 family)